MRITRKTFVILLMFVHLVSCNSGGTVTRTVLNIQFPFEPSPPGYLVQISSDQYNANLMCALDTGQILDLDSEEDISLGTCDTKSMTLDAGITDKITVTVIFGGFPVIDEVTKKPDRIVNISDDPGCSDCSQAEFDFISSFP